MSYAPRFFRCVVRRFPGRPFCRDRSSLAAPVVDLSWFDAVESRTVAQARTAAEETCRLLGPLCGVSHRGVRAVADVERGSLLLEFREGEVWRFAVSDVDAAAQLEASARLGGLVLLLSLREPGVVRIHGVWERFSYVLYGIPVRDVLAA